MPGFSEYPPLPLRRLQQLANSPAAQALRLAEKLIWSYPAIKQSGVDLLAYRGGEDEQDGEGQGK